MQKILFFTKEYKNTNSKENTFYWIEVNSNNLAQFYKKGLITQPFYTERIENIDDDFHLKSYLKILLKAVTMIQEN